jgi:antitoxin MazE
MKARIIRMGKSQGIRLSKTLLKKAKLGDEVELRAELGRIVISKAGKPRVGWAKAAQEHQWYLTEVRSGGGPI